MSSSNVPKDDAELEALLSRRSVLSVAYDHLELVEPPEALDEKVLAAAKAAAASKSAQPGTLKADVARAAPGAAGKPAVPKSPARPPAQPGQAPAARPLPAEPLAVRKGPAPRPPAPRADEAEDDVPPVRRPRWLVPAALAASVLVAVGVGISLLGTNSPEPEADASNPLGAVFAKRARERRDAEKAADAIEAEQAEVAELEIAPLPPPPMFEPEGPQVADLTIAITLIRRELVLANQAAASEGDAAALAIAGARREEVAKTASSAADAAAPAPGASAAPTAPAAQGEVSVIQPRDRRLTKILELYDGGNQDLAADSIEIFLRDFEDDPISQRILEAQPKDTDVAVE